MSRAVFRYEGTIAQLQGDALLAFFGAPVAHEDDPERAILAALDMLDATDEFARQLKATQGIDFRIRAGINSGPVMVGNVGSDLRYEYTALGDAVNVAARMQTAAEPGTIVITEMTRRLTGDTFDLDDLGEIEVKGKTEPIHAFRVIGRRPRRRRGLESVGLDSPMVGRAGSLAGAPRCSTSSPQVGVGPRSSSASRASARAAFSPSSRCRPRPVDHPLVRGPLRLVRAQLALPPAHRSARSILGFSFSATESDARAALDAALLDVLGVDRAEAEDTAVYLADLLGLPLRPGGDPDRSAGRTPEPLHRGDAPAPARAGRASRSWWSARTSTGPTRRPSTSLASSCRSRASCPSSSSRRCAPRRTPPAGPHRPRAGAVRRGAHRDPTRASQADSKTLVANLLEIESLPARVRDLILARSEGNHSSSKRSSECSSSAARSCRKARAGSPPRTSPRSRSRRRCTGCCWRGSTSCPTMPAQPPVAAVIGRQFPVRVLERVIGPSRDHDHQGGRPRGEGPHRLASIRPGSSMFRHGLVQDAAYSSLLKQERRELHGRVGAALEAVPGARGRARAGAGHALRAGRRRRARDRVLRGWCSTMRSASTQIQEAYGRSIGRRA